LSNESAQGTPRCPHFGVCGGCIGQHLSPQEQRQAKQQALLAALWQAGGLEPRRLLPPLHLATPWGYRRKARFGAKYLDAEGQALVGFRRVGSHALAELAGCPVLHPRLDALIAPLRGLLASLSVRTQVPKIEAAVGDDGQGPGTVARLRTAA
jgi:23S rRNA (uracil1939-C5)-methyltransferase